MSTMNGSTYRKTVTRSVYSDSFPVERRNGLPARPNSTMTYLEPPLRAPSRPRTPTEVAAVDPTLEDAQKAGNNYHITMSLNAALADAGLPASAAMSTGRLSQMDYAANSRAQTEYSTNSQRVSRLGFVPQVAPAWTTETQRPPSVSVVRVTGNNDAVRVTGNNDVVRVTGNNDVVAHAQFSFPVTQPRDNQAMIVNGAYTIKSVQPSSVTRQETVTTVERPKSRVGFDLELFGGQTTTVTETTSAASEQRKHGGSVGALPRGPRPNSRGDQHSTWATTSEWTSESVGTMPKGSKPKSHGDHHSTRKTTSEWNGGSVGALPKGPRPKSRGDQHSTRETTSEWTEFVGESNHQRGGMKKNKPDNRQFWNPGDSTKHLSQEQEIEFQRQRPAGVGHGVRGSRQEDSGTMSGRADNIDGMETVEYESVNPWLIYGAEGEREEDEWFAIYRSLAHGADPSSVRQHVTYGETETEVVRQKNGRIQQDLLNVDIVSENVTVVVGNNVAQMTIKVRTERIVPIDDTKELFQNSSVTVTRLIEVDMMATPERQRIYDQVLHSQRGRGLTLTQKQTFDLYKAFLRLTETDPGDTAHEEVRIDKETEEARLSDFNIDVDPILTSTSSRRSTGYRPRIL